jgi:glycosyltransferase involved in cell wall biosynthesis
VVSFQERIAALRGLTKDAEMQDPLQRLPGTPTLSIVVPRCLESASSAVGTDYEFVLVDDGSTHGTWQTIASQIERHKKIVGIKLSRNFGHQTALTAGLSAVNGRIVFVIDANLQDPPDLLTDMRGPPQ